VGDEIVGDDDVAWRQARGQLGLYISLEDWPVDEEGGDQAVIAKSCDNGFGLPVPEGKEGLETLPLWGSAAQACHLGRRAGFVAEDQAVCQLRHIRLTAPDPFAGDAEEILATA
jgi:hypothetical protein